MYVIALFDRMAQMIISDRENKAVIKEKTSLWRIEAFGGLEVIRARFKDFSFSPHTHDEYMIGVTESGKGRPCLEGKTYRINPGDLILLNPGEITAGGPPKDFAWHYRGFYPPVRLMQLAVHDLLPHTSDIPQFSQNVSSDPHLAATLRNVLFTLERQQSTLKSESLLLEILVNLFKHYAADKPTWQQVGNEHQSVSRAKEYLEAYPSKNITLEELAAAVNLSPYYFCRVFHKEIGLSPHGYQLLVRAQFAKSLLAQGIPISQAAIKAGFFDQSHLTRHFKRIFGVSPSYFFPDKLPAAK